MLFPRKRESIYQVLLIWFQFVLVRKLTFLIIFPIIIFLFLSCSSAPKAHTVLVITTSLSENTLQGFRKEMSSLKYVEGTNMTYLMASTLTLDEEGLKLKSRALLPQKPDMIFSLGTSATRAALDITRDRPIPIVFGQVATLEGTGILSEIERQQKNITGITAAIPVAKQLEYLKRISPAARRVLLVYKPDALPLPLVMRLREVSPALKMELVERQITDTLSLKELLDSLKPGEVDSLMQIPDTVGSSNIPLFAGAALRLKIPLSVALQDFASLKGVLFSYSLDLEEHGKELAAMVDKVLKGVPPAQMAVEMPKKYYLSINLDTAHEIGLAVPPDLLSLADRFTRGGNGK